MAAKAATRRPADRPASPLAMPASLTGKRHHTGTKPLTGMRRTASSGTQASLSRQRRARPRGAMAKPVRGHGPVPPTPGRAAPRQAPGGPTAARRRARNGPSGIGHASSARKANVPPAKLPSANARCADRALPPIVAATRPSGSSGRGGRISHATRALLGTAPRAHRGTAPRAFRTGARTMAASASPR